MIGILLTLLTTFGFALAALRVWHASEQTARSRVPVRVVEFERAAGE